MIVTRAFRWMLAMGCVLLAPSLSAAQGFAFPGTAWGDPADSVRARLVAAGHTFQRTDEDGDQVYQRADGAWVFAYLRSGRLVGVAMADPARGTEASARWNALRDSLEAALGPPDDDGEEGSYPSRLWVVGLESLELEVQRSGDLRQVYVNRLGPGWYDEMARRGEDPLPPAGFTIVSATGFLRISIDTTIAPRRGSPEQRGRFRVEYRQPITPTVDGVEQPPIDVVEYEMEFHCGEGRTRLVARTTFLEGRQLGTHRPQGQPWAVPQADGHYARGRDAVCRAARRRG